VLQVFPTENWEAEFLHAAKLGFSHIELLAEREHNRENPIWNDVGLHRLRTLMDQSKVHSQCICVDYILAHGLDEPPTLMYIADLINRVAEIGLQCIVLPLFEASEVQAADWNSFVEALRTCADLAHQKGMIICVESSLPAAALQMFLGFVGHPDIRVCYDTGNATALGHNVPEDICRLDHLIAHVHIKDKTVGGENVILGRGATDFNRVFSALAKIGYRSTLTLETTRGEDPLETAQIHRAFIETELEFANTTN